MRVKFILLLTITVFYITGCTFTKDVFITPDNLPDAVIGKPYRAEISIHREGGVIGGFNAPISPPDSGLNIDVCDIYDSTPNALSCIVIYGEPKQLIEIKINISGSIIPDHGVIYKVRKVFDKTYTIKVKEVKN